MVDLKGSLFTSIMPAPLCGQAEVRAIAYAISRQLEKVIAYADRAQILCSIDTMPDEVLDYIANEWRTPSYDENYPIDIKRELIKNTTLMYIQMGMPAAVKSAIQIIYGTSNIEEWYEYGGAPHYFRLCVNITNTAAVAMDADAVTDVISQVKRASAWLEGVSYMVRRGIEVDAKIYALRYKAPRCGTIRCGTYPQRSTIGYSARGGLQVVGCVDGYATTPKLCGTYPQRSTIGYSSGGGIEASDAISAYATAAPTAGDGTQSGQYPSRTTAAYSSTATVPVSVTVQSYTVSPRRCGKARCGSNE